MNDQEIAELEEAELEDQESDDEYLLEQERLAMEQLQAEEEIINQRRLERVRQREAEKQKEPKPTLLMHIFAALCDIVNILVNLLPLIGGIIVTVVLNPIEIFIFCLWFNKNGIKYAKGKRLVLMTAVSAIGFIPVINLLPKWTTELIVLRVFITAEEKLKGAVGL